MRRPKLKMRHCYCCMKQIGVRDDFSHDEFDTCGQPECRRYAASEAWEQEQERLDWECA